MYSCALNGTPQDYVSPKGLPQGQWKSLWEQYATNGVEITPALSRVIYLHLLP